MKFPFEGDWEALSDLAARRVPSAELEHQAEKLVRSRPERITPSMVRRYYVFLPSEGAGQPRGR